MLQRVPAALGKMTRGTRAGIESIAFLNRGWAAAEPCIILETSSLGPDGGLSVDCTSDGEGLSPELRWIGVPPRARSLVLLMEDADSPTPHPLVHALAWTNVAEDGRLPEGTLSGGHGRWTLGRNSLLRCEYLPCDPPPGHGEHRYCLQLFALSELVSWPPSTGRRHALSAMKDKVVARGLLVTAYERSA